MLVNRANSALKFTEPYKAITRKVSIWYILIPIPEFYYGNCANSGPSRVVYSEATWFPNTCHLSKKIIAVAVLKQRNPIYMFRTKVNPSHIMSNFPARPADCMTY
jgi:hypothetical protein